MVLSTWELTSTWINSLKNRNGTNKKTLASRRLILELSYQFYVRRHSFMLSQSWSIDQSSFRLHGSVPQNTVGGLSGQRASCIYKLLYRWVVSQVRTKIIEPPCTARLLRILFKTEEEEPCAVSASLPNGMNKGNCWVTVRWVSSLTRRTWAANNLWVKM